MWPQVLQCMDPTQLPHNNCPIAGNNKWVASGLSELVLVMHMFNGELRKKLGAKQYSAFDAPQGFWDAI